MSASNYMLAVFEQFCAEHKVAFHQIGDSVFASYNRGKNGSWQTQCHIGTTHLLFYSVLPVPTPPEKQQAIMELITLANCGRIIGNFEMNLQHGEVYFKTGINMLGGQLTTNTIYGLFFENFCTVDQYIEGVCQVIFAGMQPSRANQLIAGDADDAEEDTEALEELLSDPDIEQLLKTDGDKGLG